MQLLVGSKVRLLSSFGQDGLDALAPALDRYSAALLARTGTRSTPIYPDDPDSVQSYGVAPATSGDGFALAEVLRQIFAATGSEFTSVLILGGPDLFPLVTIPNPVHALPGFQADPDTDIPTDNYYGAAGRLLKDVLAPALACGRLLPSGSSAADLVAALDRLTAMHANHPGSDGSLAVSAAIWSADTRSVVAPVAMPADIQLAPDYQIAAAGAPYRDLRKRFLHFNLHGFLSESAWRGEAAWGAPRCLNPESFRDNYVAGSVIFAENCYGAHIVGNTPDSSCARKAVAQGAASFAGSTTYAWGLSSLDDPLKLANADLLANLFWMGIHAGKRAGVALRDAKRQFLRQALAKGNVTQLEYKTLFQFLLLGDPCL